MKRYAVFFIILYLVSVGWSAPLRAESTAVKMGVLPIVESLPFLIAQEKGLFQKMGVKVEIISFASALERDSAIQSGMIHGAIDEEQILSVLSLGASSKQVFLHTIFPACLPKILTSLRISIGTSIAVLFFVESFATQSGLGFYILDAWSTLDYLGLYTGIIGMGFLGVMLYEGVDWIEKRYCRWMLNP